MSERKTFVKFSPVTGEKLGEFPIGTPQDVQAAVARARAAQPAWADLPIAERLVRLERLSRVIGERSEDCAQRISADTGKPLLDSLMTELIYIPLFLAHYRKLAPRLLRRHKVKTPLVFAGKKSYVEYFPMGVIGVISPWNFPFQLSMVPILSALIGGNAVVLKPSEVTPLSGELVREVFAAADLGQGLVEVVQGDGSTGAALVEAEVDKIFFTGSLATGRRVMAAAARRPIPVELELGGKDAMIVCADADLRRAAKAAVWGGLLNCGQICTSIERVLVVDAIHDRFVELLQQEIARLKVGAPEEEADIGPLTFARQLEIVESQVAEAVTAGAKLLAGGARLGDRGQYFAPTLLIDVRPEMRLYREETFGPVLPIVRVADEDEAVRLANDHVYGLAASVFTRDVKRGLALASRLVCGQVTVNDVLTATANPALPFGGVKGSGFGRYHGPEGLLAFVHQKAIMAGAGGAPAEPFWFPYRGKLPAVRSAFQSLVAGKLLKVLGPLRQLNRINAEAERRG